MDIDDLAKVKGPVAGHNITEMQTASMTDTQLAGLQTYTNSLMSAGITSSNAVERVVLKTDDFVHDVLSAYVCDTTNNSITITIPFGNTNSFQVFDAKRKFNVNDVTIVVLDAGGAANAVTTIADRNTAWNVFEVDGAWYKNQIGNGLVEEIT